MGRKEWSKRCSGPAFFITGKDKGKLGYYWEHAYLKAKSGPNLGGIINPDTGAAILDSERQKLTHLDFVDKIKLFESLTLPHGGTMRYSALWQADRERIQRMAPIEYIGRYMGGWFDFAIADELHQLAGDTAQGNGLGVLGRAAKRLIALTGTLMGGYQTITLLVATATLALTIVLYIVIPKGFFPTQDTGVIQGISQAPATISFAAMEQKQQQLAHIVLQDPAVESLSSFIGADGTNTTLNSGRMSINLKPLGMRRLQASLKPVDGIELYMEPVQNITVDDRVSRTQYQYTLEDPDPNELNLWTGLLVAKMKQLPQLADVATDQQTGGLAVSLVIDRAIASRLGIAPSAVDSTLYDAYGQRQISTMYTQLNQYHVILESAPSAQQGPGKLQDLYIQANASAGGSGPGASSSFASSGSSSAGSNATTASVKYTPSSLALTVPQNALQSGVDANGSSTANAATTTSASNAVPLSAFTHLEKASESLSINHQGQFPAVTVSFNLAPNAALGGAITAIEKAQKNLNMPASVQHGFQGTAASFQGSLANEGLLILAALAAVYIVLGILYESFIHPITILSTLPSAGVGALLALILFKQDLSVVAIIGIILLIGIVKKNGIMMVDFAMEGEREHGKNATDAIYDACLLRFRPIMMTTMAALLAGIPLALGRGMGSELRRPLGIAMVGGLLLSQILTLYTTPVIYIFFDRIGQRFTRAPKAIEPGSEPQPVEES
jgi:multidrug efflux pump